MPESYSALAAHIFALPQAHRTRIVAVDGCGGSGKSTFAQWLAAAAGAAPIVHLDDFYLPSALRPGAGPTEKPIAGDYDWRRLYDQVLAPLLLGRDGRYQRYDWLHDALAEWHNIPAAPLVVIEGCYALLPPLRHAYAYRVWVECPYDLRLARGVARDGEAKRSWWVDEWMPAEDHYIRTLSPAASASLLVDGSGTTPHDLEREYIALRQP